MVRFGGYSVSNETQVGIASITDDVQNADVLVLEDIPQPESRNRIWLMTLMTDDD